MFFINKSPFKLLGFSLLLFFIFNLLSTGYVYASYQKIAPGDTITLGEFVFTDDFVPTTTPCTIGITDPLNVVKVASTTPMTANDNGWHYYNYTTSATATSGIWPSVMICGSAIDGDLVKVDKSFSVDSSLVTQSGIDTAVSTLTAEIAKGWTVTLSDFGETTVNTAYKAKLQVLNHAMIPTDAGSLPTVMIIDPVGTIQVPAGVMTKDSNGTYSYSYSIGGGAVGGVWETVVSVVINGQTVKVNDYWNLSSSPADVQITGMTDRVIPTITANVRIDNMGTSASDFYYVYCIVTSEDNLCGGNDDVDAGSDTAYINAGNFINLSLTLDGVPTAGTYWFKVKARALAETNWAASTEQFIAESGTITPPSGGGGGASGGGGGNGIATPPVTTPTPQLPEKATTVCKGADFNDDGKVNSVDFSILLAFWQKLPPFNNPCVDVNKDGQVNSVDFSILLYQWNK